MKRKKEKLLRLKSLSSFLDGVYDMPVSKYDIEKEITKLKDEIKLEEELIKVDVFGDYSISKYFYLNVDFWNGKPSVTILLKSEYEYKVYNDYICSHSGINEWVDQHTTEIYDFITGNSGYNHAFGTVSLKDIFETIEKEKDTNIIKIKVNEVVDFFNKNETGVEISKQFDFILDFALKEEKE